MILGNGSTAFWDTARVRPDPGAQPASVVRGVLVEVRQRRGLAAAPAAQIPGPIREPCRRPAPRRRVDVYAWPHNETSTGVMAPVHRVPARTRTRSSSIDATPLPAACRSTPSRSTSTTSRRRSLRVRRRAVARRASPRPWSASSSIAASGRWTRRRLDLGIALDNSRQDQTYNTRPSPRCSSSRTRSSGCNSGGGLEWAAQRATSSRQRSVRLGGSTDLGDAVRHGPGLPQPRGRHDRLRRGASTPPRSRRHCRANGIVDVEPYRKLGRNQLRIAMFPAIEPDDVEALTLCIDYIVSAMS